MIASPLPDKIGHALPAGHSTELCNCEHVCHFPEDSPGSEWHAFLAVPAGLQRADYVGAICDDCARTHMAEYLLPEPAK